MSRCSFTQVLALACIVVIAATDAQGETPLPQKLTIELLPGYSHQPLQGIDSIVGKFVKKESVEISYEIGGVPQPGQPRVGGHYSNYAQRIPAEQREWLKEHLVGGRKVSVAYGKDQRLTVSTEIGNVGINFNALAKTPEDIANVLLTTLTISAEPPKKK